MAGTFAIPRVFVSGDYGDRLAEAPNLAAGMLGGDVGVRGNNKEDVRKIQQLLNTVCISATGAYERLAVDGIVGPKTRAAINAYQKFRFRTADSHISRSGPTIRTLVLDARSALIGQYFAANGNVGKQAVEDPSPANVPENAIPLMDEIRRVKRAKDLVPEIGKQASSGLRVLAAIDAGKSEVFRQLVQKHFVPLTAVNSRQDLHRSDYDYIKSTLTAIQRQTLARAKRSDGGWRSLNKGNFGHSGDDIWSAWAETKIGAGGSLDAADPDPRSFIWLSPRLDYLADDRIFARILLHELVHYVGKSSGPDAHVDSAYLQDAGQAYSCEGATCHKADYAELATWQRIRNPDCYACFCLEATYGTDVLKSWRDQPQGEFDRPPIVKSGFGNAP